MDLSSLHSTVGAVLQNTGPVAGQAEQFTRAFGAVVKREFDTSPLPAIITQVGEDIGKHLFNVANEALIIALANKDKFEKLSNWIMDHTAEAAALLIALAAMPVALAATPAMLGLVGFTAFGPAAGSIAAVVQSTTGPVAAGSAFATLQSAAMGGYGVVAVQALVATGAATAAGIAAASFLRSIQGEEDENEKDKQE
ncbi:hypothetical protein OPT61_g5148 [Boeremia exigua]|uniref:Uncharacterized protein n=1 Tax=Boeremia exigua TaxID=749465 RepID=A0ACC2IBD7_9PLEO|nr:hypothetical protein OPT61_g5148 [Boeremia exigua]